MLLILIKRRQTRYFWHVELIEKNHLSGDKSLAMLKLKTEDMPLELFYLVSIPRSGIHLRGKSLVCRWESAKIRRKVLHYLRTIRHRGEEIYLEVSH